ncbi:thioredoxin trx1 [Monascus purpureus]|uniref:Thioredoxin n=1 Tax=Monascus purpureus TaxID=5098 RepID=A0A507R6L5_MONPU|nr:thioredoxin trx1 [Monascus purpureus]BDD62748.1 thioredoxin trx1 [Monascus purpureus]
MSHGRVVALTSKAEFQEKVIDSKELVVIDCFATWCGPCKAIAPKVAQLSETYPQAKFYQFDVDTLPDLAAELGIRAMPSFLFYKDGKRLEDDVIGANPSQLEASIKALVA